MPQIEREYTRENTFLPAKIYFNDKRSVIDCVVKNISSGGAHLKVASRLGIPNQFTLFVPGYNEQYSCWIVWSSMSEIGLSFAPRPPGNAKPELTVVQE